MHRRDLQGPGQRYAPDDCLEAQRDQERDKQEQAAKLGPKVPRLETERTRIRNSSGLHAPIRHPFLIGAARQFGEAVGLEDLPDRRRAQALTLLLERPLDIVDRAVLLAQRNHPLMQRRRLL